MSNISKNNSFYVKESRVLPRACQEGHPQRHRPAHASIQHMFMEHLLCGGYRAGHTRLYSSQWNSGPARGETQDGRLQELLITVVLRAVLKRHSMAHMTQPGRAGRTFQGKGALCTKTSRQERRWRAGDGAGCAELKP